MTLSKIFELQIFVKELMLTGRGRLLTLPGCARIGTLARYVIARIVSRWRVLLTNRSLTAFPTTATEDGLPSGIHRMTQTSA